MGNWMKKKEFFKARLQYLIEHDLKNLFMLKVHMALANGCWPYAWTTDQYLAVSPNPTSISGAVWVQVN